MRALFLFSALLAASASSLHADTLFNLSNNNFSNGAVATGTVSIDTATGVFQSVDVVVMSDGTSYVFSGAPKFQTSYDNGTQYYEASFDASGNELVIDVPGESLVGYAGGALCSTGTMCDGLVGAYAVLTSSTSANVYTLSDGSLVAAATPEPSSLVLLGTGLMGAMGVARRRLTRVG